MFVDRTHPALIKLKPDEGILYRLPPMSAGPFVRISAFDAYTTRGPHDALVFHNGPTADLELELRHSNHLSLPGTNLIRTESLWQDDLWRLWVRRIRPAGERDLTDAEGRLQYRIEATYTSQLPILERRIPASFFHDGFEANWNEQQYLNVRLFSRTVELSFREDLRQLYALQPTQRIDTSDPETDVAIEFLNDVGTISQRLDIGAGPRPLGGNAPFFSIRAEFPAVKVKFVLPRHSDEEVELPHLSVTIRLYLVALTTLQYFPVVESNLLDAVDRDFHFPDPSGRNITVNLKEALKKALEDKLFKAQASTTSGSVFGDFLAPWLVGGPIGPFSLNEMGSIGYEPGPGDALQPDGTVEPATGNLLVRYVGPRVRPTAQPVILDPTHATPAPPVDDGSVRLFDLPDEESDPLPGGGGGTGGGLTPFGPGGGPRPTRPDIGALAKIDHVVVLMQENRSFDQVLGYLSRDKLNPKVDGLLPEDDPEHLNQVNRFQGRNYFPQKADKDDPAGNPPRVRATAWPKFIGPASTFVTDPCHDTACVLSQMDGMGRFVSDFAARAGELGGTGEPSPFLRLVMDYFDAEQLPFYALLAREFAISDRWYTSHPGPTWPNRFVLLTGDLNVGADDIVEEDVPPFKTLAPIQTPTLFDHLSERGVSWRVFEHGIGFSRLFRNLTFETTNIVPFDDFARGFEAAARGGALPSVSLIEPDYIDLPPGNDDHTPADMLDGQILVERIVKALIDSPTWDRTLLIITYDEHGGFYDHRQPPSAAPPLRNGVSKLGPRVPTFFISPLVERGADGAVFFGRGDEGRFFDHTSIGATILRRFSGNRPPPRVSARLDAARDLREVLTLAEPRPRSDFDSIRQFTRTPESSPGRRALRSRTETLGVPDNPKEDFHWLLSAVRLITGEPPRASLQVMGADGLTSGRPNSDLIS
jgi:hypothetical protein